MSNSNNASQREQQVDTAALIASFRSLDRRLRDQATDYRNAWTNFPFPSWIKNENPYRKAIALMSDREAMLHNDSLRPSVREYLRYQDNFPHASHEQISELVLDKYYILLRTAARWALLNADDDIIRRGAKSMIGDITEEDEERILNEWNNMYVELGQMEGTIDFLFGNEDQIQQVNDVYETLPGAVNMPFDGFERFGIYNHLNFTQAQQHRDAQRTPLPQQAMAQVVGPANPGNQNFLPIAQPRAQSSLLADIIPEAQFEQVDELSVQVGGRKKKRRKTKRKANKRRKTKKHR